MGTVYKKWVRRILHGIFKHGILNDLMSQEPIKYTQEPKYRQQLNF